jgi:signal transduction histidine kinase
VRNALHPHRQLHLEIVAGCAVLALLLWGAIALLVYQEHARTLESVSASGRNLARTLAEYQDSSVRAIDLSLRQLREDWQRDPATFGNAVARFEEHLKQEKVIQIAVVGPDGWLRYSRLPQPQALNFVDREYFKVQKARGTDELHVSEPIMGRVTRQWAIQVTRPLYDADQRFAGVIVVAVPPPALELVLQDIQLGRRGVIMLARADGAILARTGGLEPARDVNLAGWPGADGNGLRGGEFRGVSRVDGIERFFAYRQLRDYPLVVYVGQEVGAALAPYYRARNLFAAAGVVATLLLAAVALLLIARARERARFAEERERLMLELHDSSIQSIYAIGLSLDAARRRLQTEPSRAENAIAEAEANLNLVIQDLRAFITNERRGAYSEAEFLEELRRMLPPGEEGPRLSLDIDGSVPPRLSPSQAGHVLRIVREGISNVMRHARATSARVVLGRKGERVSLEISDDGTGLDFGPRGMGLHHIEARARKLGGQALFEATPKKGTRIVVEFPK